MKIDLHVHTVRNRFLDSDFSYKNEFLEKYVDSNNIDAIAITNHNLFDEANFNEAKEALKDSNCLVLPGIEVSLETGHILVIFEDSEDGINQLKKISSYIKTQETDPHYKMPVTTFNSLCCGQNAIIIPHYEKEPRISDHVISQIADKVFVGEADSPKKFYKILKEGKYTPVYFSDIRIGRSTKFEEYENKSRFTYIDCDSMTFKSLLSALKNKDVFLSKNKIPEEFDILNGSASASTGVNVLIGKRSSGKTYTLDHISESGAKNCLYIEQFEITNNCSEEAFSKEIKQAEKEIVVDYVDGINNAFEMMDKLISSNIESDFKRYIDSLKECASEHIIDIYSKCPLFTYSEIQKNNLEEVEKLKNAVDALLSASDDYSSIVFEKIDKGDLIHVYEQLVASKKKKELVNITIGYANSICKSISQKLGKESTAKQIKKCDVRAYFQSLYSKSKFDAFINSINDKTVEKTKVFEKFERKTVLLRQKNKKAWKTDLGLKQDNNIDYLSDLSPSEAYQRYRNDSSIQKKVVGQDRYLVFFRTETTVVNENNKPVSGGQRAEYTLLNKLADCNKKYDLVLIDEMESSFDNQFLNKDVVKEINKIGQNAVVFVSTHNNNLGVSLNPNYYIYHEVVNDNGEAKFIHYCGKSNDEYLISPTTGEKRKLSEVLIDTMEADKEAYSKRKEKYEIT